jgi:hypothetical protein
MRRPVKKPVKKRTAKASSDPTIRARRLMTAHTEKASGTRKRTITLSELAVMQDGPGPFDDAHVLAKMTGRPGDLSVDKIVPISKAQKPALMSKLGRKRGKISGAKGKKNA